MSERHRHHTLRHKNPLIVPGEKLTPEQRLAKLEESLLADLPRIRALFKDPPLPESNVAVLRPAKKRSKRNHYTSHPPRA